jgi:Fe2+ or Zn2+ uptake regulation protein
MTVLDILSKSKSPIDVSILVNELGVNKTTVYRQIEKFIEAGTIIEVEFGDGKKRYEVASLDHHHHLICKKCKKIDDISFDEKVILSEVYKKRKFKVESHNLEFFGICVNCI